MLSASPNNNFYRWFSINTILKITLTSVAYVGCTLAAYYIVLHVAAKDWEDYPVKTVVKTTAYPVQNLPFPAVTVCPGNNITKLESNTSTEIIAIHWVPFSMLLPVLNFISRTGPGLPVWNNIRSQIYIFTTYKLQFGSKINPN